MSSNRAGRMLDPNSSSAAVRRKANAARKAYEAAFHEAQEIEKALAKAKKRKRAVLF